MKKVIKTIGINSLSMLFVFIFFNLLFAVVASVLNAIKIPEAVSVIISFLLCVYVVFPVPNILIKKRDAENKRQYLNELDNGEYQIKNDIIDIVKSADYHIELIGLAIFSIVVFFYLFIKTDNLVTSLIATILFLIPISIINLSIIVVFHKKWAKERIRKSSSNI